MTSTTEQETFWQGDFGDKYTDRNRGERLIAANTAFFSNVLANTRNVQKVLELGSNIGLNLLALRRLLPAAKLSAIEINVKAAAELRVNLPDVDLHRDSILEFHPSQTWASVFTKGVLIHINPESLPGVYDLMHPCSSRYILVSKYYNPTSVQNRLI